MLGAHFGTTYAHLLFQSYADLVPPPRGIVYQPRIFGFRVSEKSPVGPRMQWLRMRPPEYIAADDDDYDEDEEDAGELEEEEEEEEVLDAMSHDQNAVGKVTIYVGRYEC